MSDTGHTVKSYAEEMQSLNDDLIKWVVLPKVNLQMLWKLSLS